MGSSPRVWGQDTFFTDLGNSLRIIPTRVGTSRSCGGICFQFGDHPHACGDKFKLPAKPVTLSGSSPRVWGQVKAITPKSLAKRIIPTRVGTSPVVAICLYIPPGSSPRVWGQARFSYSVLCCHGIIPTRVGTRAGGSDPVFVDRDHPHACGDKNLCELLPKIKGGSSPRVWGQVGSRYFQQVILRIIPTRVGTSSMISKSVPASEDHPHACGDKRRKCQAQCRQPGSSPRVWGQDLGGFYACSAIGIIPTRVGTS